MKKLNREIENAWSIVDVGEPKNTKEMLKYFGQCGSFYSERFKSYVKRHGGAKGWDDYCDRIGINEEWPARFSLSTNIAWSRLCAFVSVLSKMGFISLDTDSDICAWLLENDYCEEELPESVWKD